MESLRRLAPAAYCIAALLVLLPTADYASGLLPLRPAAVAWRYEALGVISTFLLSPLLGCLIASLFAAWLPQPAVSRTLGVLSLLGAAVLLLALGGFLLDSLQVRTTPPSDARWVSTTSFLLAAAKIFAGAVALGVLGGGNLRAASSAVVVAGPRKSAPVTTVIGQTR